MGLARKIEIEKYFSITLGNEITAKIFTDAEDDQVSKKEYLIFQDKKKLLGRQLIITGKVDENEPEDIWIEIENIKEKDVRHFNEFLIDSKFLRRGEMRF